jgi:hypothetical protein
MESIEGFSGEATMPNQGAGELRYSIAQYYNVKISSFFLNLGWPT